MRRLIDRGFVLAVLGLLLGLVLACAGASGEERRAQPSDRRASAQPIAAAESLTGEALTPPSVEQFVGGEGLTAARAARRASPQAVAARAASRVKFENVSPEGVHALAADSFPQLLAPADSGVPDLAPGQRIVGYPTDYSAEVSVPGGGKRLIESLAPIATPSSNGHRVPFDLHLTQAGASFHPVRSHAGVIVPRDLSRGVTLTSVGVSLTPLTRSGKPLNSSAGALDGASVLWDAAKAATSGEGDLATLAKASPDGFELTSMLLSQRSPERLYFRVGMPARARLIRTRHGAIRVLEGATTLAVISPVSAEDAEGTNVPVTETLQGETIELQVDLAGDYLYPIAVDPEVNDSQLATTSSGKHSNWEFQTNSAHFSKSESYGGPGAERLETTASGGYGPSEYGYWGYQTKGVSHIYEIKTETSAHNSGAKVESFLEFQEPPSGAQETKEVLSTPENSEYEHKAVTLCAANASKAEECLPGSGKANNSVHFEQATTGSSSTGFSDSMTQGIVSIAEPSGTHSTSGYNTTSPTLEFEVVVEGKKEKLKRANVLYGSGSWLSNLGGALALNSADPGIGVAATKLEYESSAGKWSQLFEHNYLANENACQGVQCYVSHTEYATLPALLPDGEQTLRYRAEEAISGTQSPETEGKAKVKVDTKAPHSLEIEGLPSGNELSERAYELTVEASDGEGASIASSGVKSIALLVDGHEVGTPTGSCTVAKGQCTATRKVTLDGAELGAGKHDIEIVALDNAGNEAHTYQPVTIKHSTPVALGPGSLDLQSGDFALGATDVSLGSGLTVGRTYSSRATEAGDEGPLGPQWSLNLGNVQSLTEVVDGAVMLTDVNGRQVLFAKSGAGTFESPTGDSNLVLKLEENKATKEKLAYWLEDPTSHTKTKFTLPSGGGKAWVPSLQEGAVGADTVGYKYQTVKQITEYPMSYATNWDGAMVAGKEGNIWFAEKESEYAGRIGRISPAGVITEFALPSGDVPQGMAVDSLGNVWFSTYTNTPKLVKMSPAGTFTNYALGEERVPIHMGADASGNIWFTEKAVSEIAKVTQSGKITQYALPAESEPEAITLGSDGNMWFSSESGKVGRITAAGAISYFAVPGGGKSLELTSGADGNIWFVAGPEERKIGKITMSGVITEYEVPGAHFLDGIASGPDRNLWVTDLVSGAIFKVATTGTLIAEYPSPWGNDTAQITAGSDGKLWFTRQGSVGKIGTMTVTGTVTEPVEVWSAASSGASCEPAVTQGCRALKFSYATSTTTTGEAESKWGEFNGRLAKVTFEAYDPTAKAIQAHTVAQYSYDKAGRLRAEWDPRISPALKTTYGYDEQGHLTALTPPGQEPWTFTYGAVAGDTGAGRLLKAARAAATAEPWNGNPPTDAEAPKIAGTAVLGARLAVAHGSWSNSPLTYGYQWESCNSEEGECAPIPGASSANYTVQANDVGHTLVALVTATNGGGSATAASGATVEAKADIISEYSLAAGSRPYGVVAGSDGNVWFTDRERRKVGKVSMSGAVTEYAAESGGTPEAITSGPDGNLWFTGMPSLIERMSTAGVLTSYHVTRSNPGNYGITAGPDGNLWFTEATASYIGKINTKGEILGEYALPAGSEPISIVTGPENFLWFTEFASSKIGRITTSGSIAEFKLPAGSHPYDIVYGLDGNLWFTESGTNKVGKITTSGIVTEYSLPSGSDPLGIVVGPDRNIWAGEYEGAKIAKITTSGAITEYPLPVGSYNLTTGPDKNIWFAENGSKIGKIAVTVAEGEAHTPEPGTTINYNVPLSGSGAPHEMSAPEVAQWGQSDDPVEATAITPPDEPQSWPATRYKHATVYYLDSKGRQVNVAAPSNSSYSTISTTEYNEFNDPIRSLTPGNRQTSLEAGAASAEKSKVLDTQNTYNGEGAKEGEVAEPGTRLIESIGPQHKVTYVAGHEHKEVLARLHSKIFYDEGAPGGEVYDLPTKKTTLAQLANEEEVEVRSTKTSYSGQSNLGWKLRAPTSATSYGPEETALTKSTTAYNATTGQVTEVGSTSAETTLSYVKKFGEAGSEAGKLKTPWGDAVNTEGQLLVVDSANNRIEKFSAEGAYVSSFGTAGSGNGQLKEPQGIALDSLGNVWVADTGNSRIEEFSSSGAFVKTVGSLGTESGKLKTPSDVAIDSKGNVWVADTGNSRVEKFNKEGVYVAEFGALGTEAGKLKEPKGIAIDGGEHVWVADTANNRIQEFSTSGSLLKNFGSAGSGEGQLNTPIDLRIDAQGNIWTADSKNNRAEAFSPSGAYVTQIGYKGTGNGQLTEPKGIAFDATGKAWVTDSANNRLEQWSKGANAHDQKIVYYSAGANGEYPNCGSHPEWSGLTCETLPAKQPELMGLPPLPTTTYSSYNIYNEPETITEAFGSSTRTQKETYDAAGRRSESETTATSGKTLPKVTFSYNSEQGVLEKETAGGKSLTSEHNRLGQLTKYIDADGNIAKYTYAGPEGDDLLTETSDSSDAGTSKQSYEHDPTTQLVTMLTGSAAGRFTATYNTEGQLTSVGYPHGLCAAYSYNSVGEATSLQYKKTSYCTEAEPGVYYEDSRSPSIRGEMLKQESTLASYTYTYDPAGRLTETQERPSGEGCTVRAYSYDEESNRASATTRTPGVGGACQAEGGTTESHNYDEANRLADSGIVYDAYGNVTNLPAADAEGHALTSSYYVDNAVASQTQNGVTNEYMLDPEGRTRELVSGSTKTIDHYDGPGEAVAWSESPEKAVRNIAGIDGTLLATQTNGETPVLQLHDLQGDVVATIGDKAGETKLLSTYNSTEFGVPKAGKAPAKLAFLGALGAESSFSSGVITYGATSYVPQIAQALQSEAVDAPGLPGGSGAGAPYTMQEEAWNMQGAAREAAEAPGLEAAREQAAREAAEAAAREAEEAEEAEEWEDPMEGEIGQGGGGGGKAKGKASRSLAYALNSCTLLYCPGPSQNVPCRPCEKKTEQEEIRKKKEERKRREKEKWEESVRCGDTASYRPGDESPTLGSGVYDGGERPRDVGCSGDPGPGVDAPCEAFGCDGALDAWRHRPGQESRREPDEEGVVPPSQSVRRAQLV